MCKRLLCGLLFSLGFVVASYAEGNNLDLTMVNHYGKPLHVKLHINPEVLPDFSREFILQSGQVSTSMMMNINKKVFVNMREDGVQEHYAYWAAKIIDNKIDWHGYLGKGIAYSWQDRTITFCTTAEYNNQGHC